ncbi:hypothetical protein QJS66_20210 [Kocuria rhizophila]|nr:hypothetical protein QJS66_20210 [Kocuria rhizophila]
MRAALADVSACCRPRAGLLPAGRPVKPWSPPPLRRATLLPSAPPRVALVGGASSHLLSRGRPGRSMSRRIPPAATTPGGPRWMCSSSTAGW